MLNKKLLCTIASIILALLFIYILFPYVLVEEVGISKIQSYLNKTNAGLKIQADSLSSYWLTGVQAKNLQIANQGQPKNPLIISDLSVRVSIIPIFLGRINVTSKIKINNGVGKMFVSLSLFDLILEKLTIKEIDADFDNLKLDNIFAQLMFIVKTSNDPGLAMLIPMIENASLGGSLNGTVDYENSEHYRSQINLKIKNAFLDLNNETLNIQKQIFTAANINAEYQDSLLTVKNDTVFSAQNISLSALGTIKNEGGKTKKQTVNMKISMSLSGEIEKNFGFLLPQILKCPSSSMIGGIMNIQFSGDWDKLTCQ